MFPFLSLLMINYAFYRYCCCHCEHLQQNVMKNCFLFPAKFSFFFHTFPPVLEISKIVNTLEKNTCVGGHFFLKLLAESQ